MDALWQDLRYAARLLLKKPAFTLVAVITLALGVGANSAIFSVVNAVLLRPMPFHEPHRLALAFNTIPAAGVRNFPFSLPEYIEHRDANPAFESLATYANSNFNLTGIGDPQRTAGARVSANFFHTLGVPMAAGRGFSPNANQPGSTREVVVHHGFWQRHLGGQPLRDGVTLHIDGAAHAIVGVLPAGVQFPAEAELWIPSAFSPQAAGPEGLGRQSHRAIGRLKPGVTLEQAAETTRARAAQFYTRHANFYSGSAWRIELFDLQQHTIGDSGAALWILLAASGFLLLLCCANVANLQLSRYIERDREFSVRAALGASRSRILGMALTENLLLGILGGAAGLLLAYWSIDVIRPLAAVALPRSAEINVDLRVLAFAAALSILVSVLFGMAPACRSRRTNLTQALHSGGARSVAAGGARRAALISAEVALAVVLLAGGVLLTRSLLRLLDVNPGFPTEGRVTLQVTPPSSRYPDATRQAALYRNIVERAAALPGVTAAGGVSALPLSGQDNRAAFRIENQTPEQIAKTTNIHFRFVTPDYFRAIGIPLVEGRYLTAADAAGAPLSVVVNQSFARLYWPAGGALGRRLSFSQAQGPWYTIVGVVADVTHAGLNSPPVIEAFLSYEQPGPLSVQTMTLVVQSENSAGALPALRRAIAEVDPALPIYNERTLDDVLHASVARPRMQMRVMAAFALLALALAVVGVYGVMSCLVAQRTREIGIRMALGARAAEVFGMVLRQGLWATAWGLLLGVAAALGLSRWIATLLYGVAPQDPATYAGVAAVLVAAAALACGVPARRAARVDPIIALRHE